MSGNRKTVAASAEPGLKAQSDEQLVATIKSRVADLCRFINEADKRKIEVNFQIRKPTGGLAGSYKVEQCDVKRSL